MTALLNVKNIDKSFGRLNANKNISFDVASGEIVAILGENGAGKTTLMNIIFGHYVADSGLINFNGNELKAGDTKAAIEAGIGMVHQHFTLAENLTVLENILVGTQPLYQPRLSEGKAKAKLKYLATEFGLELSPQQLVRNLSVGEKQRLEILKTLFGDCKLLILDEPTASLTPQEVKTLFISIRKMVASGLGVILISHKLNEILEISNRIIVLRSGEVVGKVKTKNADKTQLGEMIVGRKINRPIRKENSFKEARIQLFQLSTKSGNGLSALKNVDLEVRGGEIIGVAGVAGNGQKALAEVLTGHNKPNSGKIFVNGKNLFGKTPSDFMNSGVAYIPEDRNADGIIGDMSVWENIILTESKNLKFFNKKGILNIKNSHELANSVCQKNDVRCQSIEQPARLLSGGNIQKLLIGKWLERKPSVIVACQPSRGLDEGAISAVHKTLLSERKKSTAIILISEDLDELLLLADKIVVLYNGKLSQVIENSNLNANKLGLMMAGDGF